MNDNEERPVTIITGRVWKRKGGKPEGVHVMLVAPDDDSAVRRALELLAAEGYAEAELDQIGDMDGVPDEEPHLSAFQGALEGECRSSLSTWRSETRRRPLAFRIGNRSLSGGLKAGADLPASACPGHVF